MPLSRDSRLIGQAFTVRMLPIGTAGGSVGDYIDDVGAGQVVVIDNGGRRDATVWGRNGSRAFELCGTLT